MNRATRDKFVKATLDLTSPNACWETPPPVFQQLDQDFGPFDLDLTADAQRALYPVWFGPGSPIDTDARTAVWSRHGSNGYSNPPYVTTFIEAILGQAVRFQLEGVTSTFLLPVRTSGWFRDWVLPFASDILFCDRRITFYRDGQIPVIHDPKTGEPLAPPSLFDTWILRFCPDRVGEGKLGLWSVPKHADISDLRAAWRATQPPRPRRKAR